LRPSKGKNETLGDVIEEVIEVIEEVEEVFGEVFGGGSDEPPDDGHGSGDGGGGDDDGARDLRARIAAQQGQIDKLIAILGSVASYDGVTNVIDNGLSELSAQLAPLAQIVPVRTGAKLPDNVSDAVIAMQTVLKRPNWTSAGKLTVREKRVFLIGEPGTLRANRDRASQSGGSAS
jgi:hypothetical protein